MNEATSTGDNNQNLSVIVSSKDGASTGAESPNYAELIERLTRQLRILESENLEIIESFPQRTRSVTGKLEEHKEKYRRAVDQMEELIKQCQHFKVDANERAQESEKQLYELRTIADALENENTMLRDRLRNKDVIIRQLQQNVSTERSKCTNIRAERDRLKAELSREVYLKNECLASNLDKKLRQANKKIGEMRKENKRWIRFGKIYDDVSLFNNSEAEIYNKNIEKEGNHFDGFNNIQQKKSSLSFFIPLDENFRLNDRKAQVFRERSEQRCRAIEEASRKRAIIVANRRAVASDILKGKRQLDDEAKRILLKNTSSICAFPNLLRQMRAASKRKFMESPLRRKLENERQKQIYQDINKILAHAGAGAIIR
ncbi:unnamed protein product [Meloidogyne enterolobii]|uniref:Uncharacterized protein n=1 Tax=Meloidogyne enterolobii TaxID=390850 RepID=A0ACB1AGD0_MELEN